MCLQWGNKMQCRNVTDFQNTSVKSKAGNVLIVARHFNSSFHFHSDLLHLASYTLLNFNSMYLRNNILSSMQAHYSPLDFSLVFSISDSFPSTDVTVLPHFNLFLFSYLNLTWYLKFLVPWQLFNNAYFLMFPTLMGPYPNHWLYFSPCVWYMTLNASSI